MGDSATLKKAHLRILLALIKPVVRFGLRRSLVYKDFLLMVKQAFVEVGVEEIRKTSDKVNASRVSVLTGLYRDDVSRYLKKEVAPPKRTSLPIFARVIETWRRDPRYLTKAGSPRTLSYGAQNTEFFSLVEDINKNINPGTVLFELERLGHIEKTPRGIKLVKAIYAYSKEPEKGFELLAEDIDTLITAAEGNITAPDQPANLHIRTEYDNIAQDSLPKVQRWLVEEGMLFHRRARDFMSKHDKDVNPRLKSQTGGGRAILGAFAWVSQDSGRSSSE
ncbi:MAG: hypothetical protein KDD66_02915 [Bdellovibrionales bacterium]|nr:hypothetical protein [Bdellovibrionales bacterium]